MELTEDEVREILDLVDRSRFDYFEIEYRGLKLTVSKTPAAPAAPAPEPGPRGRSDIPDGLAAIPAPMVGVFYAAPEPGAAPFVSPGDKVEPDTTVGLIEVMKVFTAVAAGLSGTIERALAVNARGVEYGEPLFLVRPDE